MRKSLLYGALLGAALLFANMSFANAHETGAVNGTANLVDNQTPATIAVTPYKEVPQLAADWAATSLTQKFGAVEPGHNSLAAFGSSPAYTLEVPLAAVDWAASASAKFATAYTSHPSVSQSQFDDQPEAVVNYMIVGRAGLATATASARHSEALTEAGTPASLSNYSGLLANLAPTESIAQFVVSSSPTGGNVNAGFSRIDTGSVVFSTAEVLAIDQSKPRFAGLQRTEHIASGPAAGFGYQADTAKKEIIGA